MRRNIRGLNCVMGHIHGVFCDDVCAIIVDYLAGSDQIRAKGVLGAGFVDDLRGTPAFYTTTLYAAVRDLSPAAYLQGLRRSTQLLLASPAPVVTAAFIATPCAVLYRRFVPEHVHVYANREALKNVSVVFGCTYVAPYLPLNVVPVVVDVHCAGQHRFLFRQDNVTEIKIRVIEKPPTGLGHLCTVTITVEPLTAEVVVCKKNQ